VRTIVCGIDGSPGARSALRIATELAGALRLRVVAVHVADSFGGDHTSDAPLAISRVRGNAERLLANVLYDEQLVGLVDWRTEVGNVAEQRPRSLQKSRRFLSSSVQEAKESRGPSCVAGSRERSSGSRRFP
jgi:nucleotide-binding universal stress UspA family protein